MKIGLEEAIQKTEEVLQDSFQLRMVRMFRSCFLSEDMIVPVLPHYYKEQY
jgi:hypothetical protein